jgi:hypothetical protein
MDGTDDQPHNGRGLRRILMWLSLAAVAAGAAYGSYIHALAVCIAADGHRPVAWVVAGLADPAIGAASVNLTDAAQRDDRLPRWSVASLAVAMAVTLVMNVAAGNPRAVPAWVVNAWVPVALTLTLESLVSFTKRGRGGARTSPASAAPAAHSHPEATVGQPPRAWLDEQIRHLRRELSERETAEALGISRGRVATAAVASMNGQSADG